MFTIKINSQAQKNKSIRSIITEVVHVQFKQTHTHIEN